MSCPGGALFFQPLGPEIPSAENLLKITPNNCGLVHIKLRRAGARARAGFQTPRERCHCRAECFAG